MGARVRGVTGALEQALQVFKIFGSIVPPGDQNSSLF